MSIKTILNQARSFEDLATITQNAKGKISFWGSSYIQVEGHQDTLHIDSLAQKIMKLIMQEVSNNDSLCC